MTSTVANPENIFLHRRAILCTLCLGVFLSALDTTEVIISLPQIARSFRCSLAQISWIVVAYLLTHASLLVTFGRLGDLLAPGRLYLLGLLVFAGASALCGFSPWLFWLISGRALQGVAASLILALGPKLVSIVYGSGKRGLPLGLITAAGAVGVGVGAPLGGFITAHCGWPYIFFINLPICALTLIIGSHSLMWLPSQSSWDYKKLNLPAGLILAGSLGALVLALDWLRDRGCKDCWALGSLVVATGLFGLFLYVDRRQEAPFLNPELWRKRTFIFGSVGIMPASGAYKGSFFLLPFFLEHVYLYSPFHSGLLLAILAITVAIVAPLGGRLADRLGNLLVLRIGAGFLLLGLFSFLFTHSMDSPCSLAIKLAFLGAGYGLIHTPNLNEVLCGSQSSLTGLAASSVYVLQKVGAISGITMVVAVFAYVQQHHILLGPGVYLELNYFHLAFTAMALVGAVNLFVHLILRK